MVCLTRRFIKRTIRFTLYVGCLGILVACLEDAEPSVRQSLAWVAPAEYEDGSKLTDLAGFRVYRNGEMVLDLSDPNRVGVEFDGESGDVIWVTAYDANGAESMPSNDITFP